MKRLRPVRAVIPLVVRLADALDHDAASDALTTRERKALADACSRIRRDVALADRRSARH